jgi:hypothetical protein
MTTSRRIDEHTAERITIQRRTTRETWCDQCGMYCVYTDSPPEPNHYMRAGETRCYACQWANVSLSGRKYAGISFEDFMDRKNHVARVQGII